MRFHDYHLAGYVVSDFGRTVTLKLALDFRNFTKPDSEIQFSDVAYYAFIHSEGAIITDLYKVPLPEFLESNREELESNAHMYGVRYWSSDFQKYREYMIDNGFNAWNIDSAIGFTGQVIAKSVSQIRG